MAEGLQLAPGEGTSVANPVGGTLTFKARGSETGGRLTVVESVAAPGEGPPLHRHEDVDEMLYALEGEFRFALDGEVRAAPAGSFMYIPRGAAHTWLNAGSAPARILAIFTPAAAGMETFFERFAALPAGEMGPEAFRRLASSAGGMEVLGPPLA